MVWACNVAALGPLRIVVRCSKMRAKAASRQLRLAFGGIYFVCMSYSLHGCAGLGLGGVCCRQAWPHCGSPPPVFVGVLRGTYCEYDPAVPHQCCNHSSCAVPPGRRIARCTRISCPEMPTSRRRQL
ncbi:hypothetical protein DOS86_00750 [Anaplasma marginale]|uniref:Uncharacterized protein n=1 Tax=Anaplasma marginale (strain Florida) TaxID=320483 RepID=B9KI38_ANAMF|nr:hypothetical protein AM378 [Anaplasma marginale str. St. Maries]AAV86445.1 hypothetical protein AM380 [Anaplasma marginale str. St. Maries]ACM49150.1 Hypothetical protein AMF_1039 [Anaplasma marginale str. Florida]RCL20254.1 hypothetical protein DOS86_00750 [Anaplasma marginale]